MPVALAAGYTETYGADTACPEQHLWLAVLAQAAADLVHGNPRIRTDALLFFQGRGLLRVLDLAGIGRADVPWLRRRALELVEAAQTTPTGPGKHITYQGQTRTLTQWARITGVTISTLSRRLDNGWGVEQTLTLPPQKAGRRGLQ